MEIFKILRPLINSRGGQTGAFKHQNDDEILIEADYVYYFEGKHADSAPYQLMIQNNLPIDSGVFTSS